MVTRTLTGAVRKIRRTERRVAANEFIPVLEEHHLAGKFGWTTDNDKFLAAMSAIFPEWYAPVAGIEARKRAEHERKVRELTLD